MDGDYPMDPLIVKFVETHFKEARFLTEERIFNQLLKWEHRGRFYQLTINTMDGAMIVIKEGRYGLVSYDVEEMIDELEKIARLK
jgi:hypothetical protein